MTVNVPPMRFALPGPVQIVVTPASYEPDIMLLRGLMESIADNCGVIGVTISFVPLPSAPSP